MTSCMIVVNKWIISSLDFSFTAVLIKNIIVVQRGSADDGKCRNLNYYSGVDNCPDTGIKPKTKIFPWQCDTGIVGKVSGVGNMSVRLFKTVSRII